MKQDVETHERECKMRLDMAKKRVEENKILLTKKRQRRVIDIDRYPLLSKPSDSYAAKSKKPLASLASSVEINRRNSLSVLTELTPSLFADVSLTSFSNAESTYDVCGSVKSRLGSDGSKANAKSCLRNIYSAESNATKINGKYSHFNLEEHIADIFISFTIGKCSKFMTHNEFQSFTK